MMRHAVIRLGHRSGQDVPRGSGDRLTDGGVDRSAHAAPVQHTRESHERDEGLDRDQGHEVGQRTNVAETVGHAKSPKGVL